MENLTQEISTHHGVNITPNADPDSDNIDDEIREEWQAKQTTESPMFSYESDSTCSNRSCGREGLTLNRMAPVQMRMSRAQPKAVDCVSDATTNSYLREWQLKPATECSMFSCEYVREAPTNNRRNSPEKVKVADSLYIYIVMSTILITTSTLQTPTLTIPILYAIIILTSVIVAHAPLVNSTLAYLPSPGSPKLNQHVTRVNPWGSRILRTEATRTHERQERDIKRSVPNRAHLQHL
jgi:hypothetical protein